MKNSDGTTKIIGHQGIQSVHTTPKASGETSSQKVQIIRGSDGKVSVRGLNPGQQLIQMPDGKLHVLTSTTPGQKAGSAILRQSGNPKVITKVINHQQTTSNATPTTQKVLIRQQVQQKTPTMIVKSAMQKVTPQRVLINSAQGGSSTPSQKLPIGAVNSPQKIITSKGQLLAATPQKVAQTSNLQQILTQAPVGQKILINQANTGNKLIVATQQQTVAPQQTIIQTVAQTQPTQQLLVNQPTQKVVQQYVNSTNQQQQIIVGNQRILLNPGQRIITQQQPPQVIQQVRPIPFDNNTFSFLCHFINIHFLSQSTSKSYSHNRSNSRLLSNSSHSNKSWFSSQWQQPPPVLSNPKRNRSS